MTADATSFACGVGSVVMELLQNKGSGWRGKVTEDEIMRLVNIHESDGISDRITASRVGALAKAHRTNVATVFLAEFAFSSSFLPKNFQVHPRPAGASQALEEQQAEAEIASFFPVGAPSRQRTSSGAVSGVRVDQSGAGKTNSPDAMKAYAKAAHGKLGKIDKKVPISIRYTNYSALAAMTMEADAPVCECVLMSIALASCLIVKIHLHRQLRTKTTR